MLQQLVAELERVIAAQHNLQTVLFASEFAVDGSQRAAHHTWLSLQSALLLAACVLSLYEGSILQPVCICVCIPCGCLYPVAMRGRVREAVRLLCEGYDDDHR